MLETFSQGYRPELDMDMDMAVNKYTNILYLFYYIVYQNNYLNVNFIINR